MLLDVIYNIYSGRKIFSYYLQTSNISRTSVGNELLSTQIWLELRRQAIPQLYLPSGLNTWLQWFGQRQVQDEARNI